MRRQVDDWQANKPELRRNEALLVTKGTMSVNSMRRSELRMRGGRRRPLSKQRANVVTSGKTVWSTSCRNSAL